MRSFLNRVLGRRAPVPSEIEAYKRLKEKGFSPDRIIDVGAYEGSWTRLVRTVFADTHVTMIEAQHGKMEILGKVCRDLSRVNLVSALLSDMAGKELVFYEMETGSSLRPENSNVARIERKMVTQTLDDVVGSDGQRIFLKIDVQGAELDILAGGQGTLGRCEIVQLETALLPYNAGAPQITEVLVKMDAWGFVPYDFAGFIRPNGIDLVQTDILFVRRGSPLRPSHFTF